MQRGLFSNHSNRQADTETEKENNTGTMCENHRKSVNEEKQPVQTGRKERHKI